jgi:hypothetical protein
VSFASKAETKSCREIISQKQNILAATYAMCFAVIRVTESLNSNLTILEKSARSVGKIIQESEPDF